MEASPGFDMAHNMSWVDPYLESPWVKVISSIAPKFPPPGDETSEVWRHFASALVIGAGVLAAMGFLAALAVLIKSCVSCPRRAQSRPSTKPLICTAVLTFLLLSLGSLFYWTLASTGVNSAISEFKEITTDVTSVQQQGLTLASIGKNISDVVDQTLPKCKQDYQQAIKAKLVPEIESYRNTVGEFNDAIKDLPRQLHNVTKLLDTVSTAGVVSLSSPMALALLCILAIVFIVCSTRGGRGSGNCSHCCIRLLGPLLFAPAILIVTAFTAAEFGISLGTASFCKDADQNTLSYIKKYGSNDTYEVARYYITGKGANPYMNDLQAAQDKLEQTGLLIQGFAQPIAQECHSPDAVAKLQQSIKDTSKPITKVQQLLEPSHVYPYYKKAVHDDACKTLISGVCWLVVFQLLVGLLCLPCLTLMADSFFERWRTWHSSPARQGLIHPEMSV